MTSPPPLTGRIGPKPHRGVNSVARIKAFRQTFAVDEFQLIERGFHPHLVPETETHFALANGYLGIRGVFEEGQPVHQGGTLLNGFHETWPITYAEDAYGFARTGQTIVNVSDATPIKLYVDDERFNPATDELLSFERVLDMRAGLLRRDVLWRTAAGSRIRVRSERLVSFEHRHLAAMRYEVELLDEPASLVISSELATPHEGPPDDDDPRRGRSFDGEVLVPVGAVRHDDGFRLAMRTRASGIDLACGVAHTVRAGDALTTEVLLGADSGRFVVSLEATPGSPLVIEKFAAYHYSDLVDAEELLFRVDRTLTAARRTGYDGAAAGQRRQLDQYWAVADVQIDGAPDLQQAIRFNLFQLLQATARAEGHGVAAKGLTGQGYEGHYFWDTEIYILPFLVYTNPAAARSVLLHRYGMLDQARARAAELGHRGAMFPWRTINGLEASAYYAAGTAQYHLNADISYAMVKYALLTGDRDFLARYGAEVLVETARLWIDLGFFSDRHDGEFVVNGVTGPDEYTALVNNNTFTNLMARHNLRAATDVLAWLARERPDDHRRVVERTGLDPTELDDWSRAAEGMHIPYDERMQVHLQDDGFLDCEPWDFDRVPADRYPLLLHFHPLVIYRHQVIKQADVVLATFLLGHEFTPDEKERVFRYYDPLTTGDSSLSESIQAIMALELGEGETGFMYFADAVALDLADLAGNVRDGVHAASCGGVWMALVYGFAGLRDHGGALRFDPQLPATWTQLRFTLRARGTMLEVAVTPERTTYRVVQGDAIQIIHHGEPRSVTPDEPLVIAEPCPRLDVHRVEELVRTA